MLVTWKCTHTIINIHREKRKVTGWPGKNHRRRCLGSTWCCLNLYISGSCVCMAMCTSPKTGFKSAAFCAKLHKTSSERIGRERVRENYMKRNANTYTVQNRDRKLLIMSKKRILYYFFSFFSASCYSLYNNFRFSIHIRLFNKGYAIFFCMEIVKNVLYAL